MSVMQRQDSSPNHDEAEAQDVLCAPPTFPAPDRSPNRRLFRSRKMSFPAASPTAPLPSPASPTAPPSSPSSLIVASSSSMATAAFANLDLPELANQRIRRFSNVSDAVSRKLSTTIGWRTVTVHDIVTQAKSLCSQYVRSRLKRAGVFTRKLGLQRLRSMSHIPAGVDIAVVAEVYAQLQAIGLQLENLYPKLYTGISRQVAVTITSEKSVRAILSSIARDLFKTEISWGKVVSLYCVAGGLAVDCVRQGHPEYLFGLVEAMGLVVERDVATWMAQQGGWNALLSRYRPPDEDHGVFQMIALSVVCLIVLLVVLVFVIRTLGRLALSVGVTRAGPRPTHAEL